MTGANEATFATEFEPIAAEFEQQQLQQLQQQKQCGEKNCLLPGVPLEGTIFKCRHCQTRIHGPCGNEAKVERGMVTIVGKDITFPIQRLNPLGRGRPPLYGVDGYSQICISCVEELKAPSISNSNSAAAVDPAVLALFPDMQPDTPLDIITDMLLDAKEGRSGPLLQGLYAQHFSHGSALVVVPREDEQDGEDYDEEVDEVAAADLDTAAVMKERVVHRTRDGYERRNIAFMIWLFDNHGTCRHLIEPTIFWQNGDRPCQGQGMEDEKRSAK